MPYKEKEISKLYWTIGELSASLDVHASTIRFWLKEFGLDSQVKRSHSKKDRRFSATDVETITEIHRLLHEELYTIPGARRQLELRKKWVSESSSLKVQSL